MRPAVRGGRTGAIRGEYARDVCSEGNTPADINRE